MSISSFTAASGNSGHKKRKKECRTRIAAIAVPVLGGLFLPPKRE
jgi:hypothetical protein